MIKTVLTDALLEAARAAINAGTLPDFIFPPVILEIPKDDSFGDYATNFALQSAKLAKCPPRKIAEALLQHFKKADCITELSLAGPGFINFRLSNHYWQQTLKTILEQKEAYASLALGAGKKVQVEFVSANPTGPLHIGHGRGAAVGDCLARLLSKAGYTVVKEYYINDAGRQMNILGETLEIRYRQLFDPSLVLPEESYKGQYMIDLALALKVEQGDSLLSQDRAFFTAQAQQKILQLIKGDLEAFSVSFDVWQSEKELCDQGAVRETISWLTEAGYTKKEEGALWFTSSKLGDDKDRVLIRSNGETTYLASDIAYHKHKYDQGYDQIINIWGADHHGYVARIKAAVEALGHDPHTVDVLLIQLVSLVRGGEKIAMSTRGGTFVTLQEVIDEVGADAARFFFLLRRYDSQYEFDLELAKQQSNENPVFYVQYAYTRTCGIMRQWKKRGHKQFPDFLCTDLSLLTLSEEIILMKQLAHLPQVISQSALALEPHRLTFYAQELAAALHRYYYNSKIITDDAPLTAARLTLIYAVQVVLAEVLRILGVSAPEVM